MITYVMRLIIITHFAAEKMIPRRRLSHPRRVKWIIFSMPLPMKLPRMITTTSIAINEKIYTAVSPIEKSSLICDAAKSENSKAHHTPSRSDTMLANCDTKPLKAPYIALAIIIMRIAKSKIPKSIADTFKYFSKIGIYFIFANSKFYRIFYNGFY